MELKDLRKYLETGFGARHIPTGRVYILVPSHDISAEVLGGVPGTFIEVAETFMEVMNGLLIPSSIPQAFMLDDFKAVALAEMFPRAFSDAESLHDNAVAENRIGAVHVSQAALPLFQRYLNLCAGASIVDEIADYANDRVNVTLYCPDFRPVRDGEKTPIYMMQVVDGSNAITWVLDKRFEL